jgi:hypothetical protein
MKELTEEKPPLPPREMAKRCGYYTLTEEGELSVNMIDFYNAVLNIENASLNNSSLNEARERGIMPDVNFNGISVQ